MSSTGKIKQWADKFWVGICLLISSTYKIGPGLGEQC